MKKKMAAGAEVVVVECGEISRGTLHRFSLLFFWAEIWRYRGRRRGLFVAGLLGTVWIIFPYFRPQLAGEREGGKVAHGQLFSEYISSFSSREKSIRFGFQRSFFRIDKGK